MERRVLFLATSLAAIESTVQSLRASGFAVTAMTHQDFEIAQLAVTDPDVILLDIAKAAGAAPELCRQIRAASNAGIIVIAGRCRADDRISGLEAGADDYMCRPFDANELVARLHSLMRRRHAVDATALVHVGELVIDPSTGEVSCGSRMTNLTHRELELLLVLAERPGHPVAREFIQRRIWRTPWARHSDPVKVYVAYLRKKLLALGLGDLIQTLRGFGYELRLP